MIGSRLRGGVAMIERSRAPMSEKCSVRGIGVAVRARACRPPRAAAAASPSPHTPKRCSSSMISKPEILEADVLREQPVGPDDDVQRSPPSRSRMAFCSFSGLKRERTSTLTPYRASPVQERVVVLHRQDRGRHQHRDLLAVHDRLEGRTHGHFRFSEPDIAADQPVHRMRGSPCPA